MSVVLILGELNSPQLGWSSYQLERYQSIIVMTVNDHARMHNHLECNYDHKINVYDYIISHSVPEVS